MKYHSTCLFQVIDLLWLWYVPHSSIVPWICMPIWPTPICFSKGVVNFRKSCKNDDGKSPLGWRMQEPYPTQRDKVCMGLTIKGPPSQGALQHFPMMKGPSKQEIKANRTWHVSSCFPIFSYWINLKKLFWFSVFGFAIHLVNIIMWY